MTGTFRERMVRSDFSTEPFSSVGVSGALGDRPLPSRRDARGSPPTEFEIVSSIIRRKGTMKIGRSGGWSLGDRRDDFADGFGDDVHGFGKVCGRRDVVHS